MNQIQDIKMTLLDKFGIIDEPKSVDFCREAYKFLTEDAAATDGSQSVSPASNCNHVPKLVDLGLPSGTRWCDRNVGANSPEDYGAFFSWGNTEPHFPNRKDMDWGDVYNAFEDYSFDSDNYEKTEGYKLDGDIDIAHDAARVNMGEPWQMPTEDQFQELYDNCTWVRKTLNGVNGYLVTSKINSNSIFFPCSGYGYGSSWYSCGGYGYYWSASFYSARRARVLVFLSGGVNPQDVNNRYNGFAVRAVQNNVPKK